MEASAMTLAIGKQAPDFTLTDEHGQKVKLSQFKGKRVILYFYPKDDTPGCTTQACGFRDRYIDIEEMNGIVLGISPQDAKSHLKFKTKYKLPFILLSDPDHAVAEKYGAWGEKSLYGKKYMGIIRSHFVIDQHGKIADIQIKVSPSESVARALKALA
jgi:peroxiredoxin Q/BCP